MKRLVLGGVKSGKSLFAEQQVIDWEKASAGEVLYIATAESHNDEFSERIARHRAQRPAHWTTIETPVHISEIIEQASGQGKCILLECLTLWMSNLLADGDKLDERVDQLCAVFERYEGEIIIVSNETGLGIMPDNALARRFGDALGVLHQRLASLSDEVVMVVAGLPQFLKKFKYYKVTYIMDWTQNKSASLNIAARDAALVRQGMLTKPPGSLGQLEAMAVWLAERQGHETPAAENIWISVFAADHGVMAQNVSAFPQVVTGEMIKNFATGGAAISVLAKSLGAQLEVINLGTVNDPGEIEGVVYAPVAPQTANMAEGAAMTPKQLEQAMLRGREAAERAHQAKTHILICGDMGIGNTTSSAALACAYLQLSPEKLVGPGTGVDAAGVQHKAQVVSQALEVNQALCESPQGVLQALGGFEIAAMTGAMIRSAQLGQCVLVDGYIASTAALSAVRMNASVRNWLHFSHRSAEPGHAAILAALNATTVLDLGMRLGEASGAAVAVPLFRLACDLHNNMATFEEAGVSEA